jgi:hypothetical protein
MLAGQDFIADVAILSTELAKESWGKTIWSKYSGNVEIKFGPDGRRNFMPSGSPIEIMKTFIEAGRDNMLIPFLKDLTGAPSYGDTPIVGTGEQQVLWWLRSYINQTRKPVETLSGNMSYQRQKAYRLMEAAKPQLVKYIAKLENQEVSRAFYEGVSGPLSASNAVDGLGVVKRYHPNFYVNDGGVLTAVGTENRFKTVAQIDTAVTNADTVLTSAILGDLRVKCLELGIQPMWTKSGFQYWPLLVHPYQLESLLVDTAYKASSDAQYMGAKENPELQGMGAFWRGFAVFDDIHAVRSWDGSTFFGSTIETMFAPTTTTTNKCAIVFGAQAMGKGVAEDVNFTYEDADHQNVKEIAFRMQNGYNRADYVAEADASEASGGVFYKNTTGTGLAPATVAVRNQSSLILMTDEGA